MMYNIIQKMTYMLLDVDYFYPQTPTAGSVATLDPGVLIQVNCDWVHCITYQAGAKHCSEAVWSQDCQSPSSRTFLAEQQRPLCLRAAALAAPPPEERRVERGALAGVLAGGCTFGEADVPPASSGTSLSGRDRGLVTRCEHNPLAWSFNPSGPPLGGAGHLQKSASASVNIPCKWQYTARTRMSQTIQMSFEIVPRRICGWTPAHS